MGFLKVAWTKDLRRIARDPASVGLSVLIPLVLAVLLRLISGGGGERKPVAKLLIADHDSSVAGQFLMGAFSRGELADLVDTEGVTEEEGRRLMERGKASGLLIIPAGFGDKVLDREPVTLSLVTNPAQRILPGILEGVLGGMVDGLNGAQLILGNSVDPLLDRVRDLEGTPPDALVAELSVTANRLVRRVEPYLFPPAIDVKVAVEEEERVETRSFAEIFFPSMLFLALVFAAQSLSDDVWTERVRGTLRRSLTTPGRLAAWLGGKLLAGGVVLALVAVSALLVGRALLRIPFHDLPLAMIWAAGSALFMLLLFTLVQLLAGSQRGGNLLTQGITFPLVMLGGSFFPFEVMPDWMVRIGRLTPNGWALTRLTEILNGTAAFPVLALSALLLAGLGALLYLASLRRLQVFARG